jgi:hypothetical protein
MQEQNIKSLTPILCPHCGKDIIIEIISDAPKLTGIFTPELLQSAKNEALRKISEMDLPSEFTKATIDWINDPNTIFGPHDVEEIIKNIQKPDREDQDEEMED